MSVNVYLKGDEVMGLEGFDSTRKSLPGNIVLFQEKGRWYFTLSDPSEPIPATVAGIVEEISLHAQVPCYDKREAGIYRFESAEAEIEQGQISGRYWLQVRIKAKKMEDLRALLHMIRAGSIRSEVSYENQQVGTSRAELEAKLAEATLERMQQTDSALESLKADLRTLCRQLEVGWSFCAKKKVRREISTILKNHGG